MGEAEVAVEALDCSATSIGPAEVSFESALGKGRVGESEEKGSAVRVGSISDIVGDCAGMHLEGSGVQDEGGRGGGTGGYQSAGVLDLALLKGQVGFFGVDSSSLGQRGAILDRE